MRDFDNVWRRCISSLDEAGRRRHLRSAQRLADGRLITGGTAVVDFSSNDHIGLSQHPEMVRRAWDFTARWGAGSAASRLFRGNIEPFAQIERKLADSKAAGAFRRILTALEGGFSATYHVLYGEVIAP